MPHALRPVLAALCALVPFAAWLPAQQGQPKPSPELAKLEPMIGSWSGSGTMGEASTKTKWRATGTYRLVLGGFWIQEDFTITFEGNADPVAFRAYLGWDAERRTFVNVSVDNAGEAHVHDFTLQPDGTMLQLTLQNRLVVPYAERSLSKITGDTMTHSIDVLPPKGPSIQALDGTFERQDADAPSAFDAKGRWMGVAPDGSMQQQLARMAGSYQANCDLVMKPGQPAIKIKGVDTFRPIFGGRVLFARTDAETEGMPGKYECDAFWAWNARKESFVLIAVNNLGGVAEMEARFTNDLNALVATRAMTMEGQPAVARTVIGLDDKGQPSTILSHLMVGTSAPFEYFNGTFTKK